MKTNHDEHDIVDKILELLRHDMSNEPVTARIATNLMSKFMERLHRFSGSGFAPESVAELEIILDELFGDTLRVLKATSIHSNHRELAAYKGYWEHRNLGPFFKEKNQAFLNRGAGRTTMRIYVCDSMADSVAEPWFHDTVIGQIRDGALVKVIQIIEKEITTYEDFGIYEHKTEDIDAGTYLLRAPKEENLDAPELRTTVTASLAEVKEYVRKFDRMWKQSDQIMEVPKSPQLEAANRQPLQTHGEGCINDLFEKRIILRKMERLDTREKLLPESAGFVRKYQPQYARAVSHYIEKRFPEAKHLFYVGDTYKNDGTAIRNLQGLGWDVTGFICEPKLKIERLWFNSVLYSNRWTDLVGFVERVREKIGPQSLALFDIDQTLWAPKGIAEAPLNRTRIEAILKLVDEYVDKSKGEAAAETAERAKARIMGLYEEISEVKYHSWLTLDNEDYKAAICVFLGLNAVWDQGELEARGLTFFKDLSRLDPSHFMKKVTESYLLSFRNPDKDGEANMTQFIVTTLAAVQTKQFYDYGAEAGLDPQRIERHLRDIFEQIVGPARVKYGPFRSLELQEALALAGGTGDPKDRLVLNKSAWDFASLLKRRKVPLLGLSDRPDESTIGPGGESLLDARMAIYGRPIDEFIAANFLAPQASVQG